MNDAEKRFWSKVDKTDDCWVWLGAKTLGYGRFRYNGKIGMAHRIAYLFQFGTLDDTLVVDHKCFNRACVRGDHLQQISREKNASKHKPTCPCSACNPELSRKTVCSAGHDLTLEGARTLRGKGTCRICQNDYNREWMRRYRSKKN